jgi:hypothetical protein
MVGNQSRPAQVVHSLIVVFVGFLLQLTHVAFLAIDLKTTKYLPTFMLFKLNLTLK